MAQPAPASRATERRPRPSRAPQTELRASRRQAAERLGRLCSRLVDYEAFPPGPWALPRQERTAAFLAVLGEVYGTDNERARRPGAYRSRFDHYRADYDAVMPAVRVAALNWAVNTLDAEEQTLRGFQRQLTSERGLASKLHEAAKRARQNAEGLGTSSTDEARQDWGDAHPRRENRSQPSGATPSAREVMEQRQAEERARQRRLARIAWAVKQQRVRELSILFQHPRGLALVTAFAESADEGTRAAREVLDDAIQSIVAFRAELRKRGQEYHVWRYPVLVTGGVARLGLSNVSGFTNYAIAIGQALSRSRAEEVIGAFGIVLMCVGLVFMGPAGLIVIGVADLALGGAATALAYVREHEQELASGAGQFRGETHQLAASTGYTDTALNGAAALLAAFALFKQAANVRKMLKTRAPAATADVAPPPRSAPPQRPAPTAPAEKVPARATERPATGATPAKEKDWRDFLPESKKRVQATKDEYKGVDMQANANRSRGVPSRRPTDSVPELPIPRQSIDSQPAEDALTFFRQNRSAYPKEIRDLIDKVPLAKPPKTQLRAIDKAIRDLHTAEANRMAGFANAAEKPFIGSQRAVSNEGGELASMLTDEKILSLKGQIRGGGTAEFDSVQFTGSRIIEKKMSLRWTNRSGQTVWKSPADVMEQMKAQAEFVEDWQKWSKVEWQVHDYQSALYANGIHGELQKLHPGLASRIDVRDFSQ